MKKSAALLTILGLTVSLCLLGCVRASPEGWGQTYGGENMDIGYCVIETSDGACLIAGTTNSSGGNFDFWLIKTDSNGVMLWNQTYGEDNYDCAYSVIETTDGDYVITGSIWSFGFTDPFTSGSNNFWLVKTDSDGNVLWKQTFGRDNSDIPFCVIETTDGGYALAGYTGNGDGNDDFWLIKTDKNGTMMWNQSYGGSENDVAHSLIQTSDEGFALVGYTHSVSDSRKVLLVKTDNDGKMQWNQTYGTTIFDTEAFAMAHDLVETADGGFAIAAEKSVYMGGHDFWLIKTDQEGIVEWNQTYGKVDFEFDRPESVIVTSDGGFVIAGETTAGSETGDAWLIKTDDQGNIQWNKTYGGELRDAIYSVIETSNGEYILTGYTWSFGAGKHDVWLIKTDELGVVPEFSSWTSLLFVSVIALGAIVGYRKKLQNQGGQKCHPR